MALICKKSYCLSYLVYKSTNTKRDSCCNTTLQLDQLRDPKWGKEVKQKKKLKCKEQKLKMSQNWRCQPKMSLLKQGSIHQLTCMHSNLNCETEKQTTLSEI